MALSNLPANPAADTVAADVQEADQNVDGNWTFTSVTSDGDVTAGDDFILSASGSRVVFNHASQAQTTVGAAGGASALPATPTKYFKVVDSAGTELIIPAYAAS